MKNNEKMSVADYFTQQVELCGKSQAQISKEMGFPVPNVISNIKAGKTKLPLTRVGLAARSLGLDAFFLLKMVIKEYFPVDKDPMGLSFWDIIEQAAGKVVTDNEYALIQSLRKLTNDTNPAILTDDSRQKLKELADTMVKSNN